MEKSERFIQIPYADDKFLRVRSLEEVEDKWKMPPSLAAWQLVYKSKHGPDGQLTPRDGQAADIARLL